MNISQFTYIFYYWLKVNSSLKLLGLILHEYPNICILVPIFMHCMPLEMYLRVEYNIYICMYAYIYIMY